VELTRDEQVLIRKQASAALCNLVDLWAFYSAACRRFFARSADRCVEEARRAGRGRAALPPDAVLVGRYAHPCRAAQILDDIIATPPPVHEPAAPAALQEPAPTVAAPRLDPAVALAVRDPTPPRFNPFDPPSKPAPDHPYRLRTVIDPDWPVLNPERAIRRARMKAAMAARESMQPKKRA
jgi:hypothetical protein